MERSIQTRLIWPDGPFRVIFSVLAVFSAVGMYFLSPRFAESGSLFAISALALFAFEVLGFELGMRRVRAHVVLRRKHLRSFVQPYEFVELINQVDQIRKVLTDASLARYEADSRFTHLVDGLQDAIFELKTRTAQSGQMAEELLALRNAVDALTKQMQEQFSSLAEQITQLRPSHPRSAESSRMTRELGLDVLSSLNPVEKQLISLIVHGYNRNEIADKLEISRETVRNRIRLLLSKTEPLRRAGPPIFNLWFPHLQEAEEKKSWSLFMPSEHDTLLAGQVTPRAGKTLGLWLWLLAVTRPEISRQFNLSLEDVERFVRGQSRGRP